MKIKYYLLLAIFAYSLFLISTLPATLVLDTVAGKQTKIVFIGVSGTLWHGRAEHAELGNSLELNQLQWNFIFWRLLSGELSTSIQARFQQQPLLAKISITPTGTLIARDVHALISAKEFALLAQIPIAQLGGLISLDFDTAYWKKNAAPVATGLINWKNATITVAETVQLGTTSIKLQQTPDNSMDVKISNLGGDLKLNGQANLDSKANYALKLNLIPTQSATQNLINSLAVFAKRQRNGTFVIQTSGQLVLPGVI